MPFCISSLLLSPSVDVISPLLYNSCCHDSSAMSTVLLVLRYLLIS